MDSRERVRRVLAGERPDRIPIYDAYWETTLTRWHQEGLRTDVSPQEALGCDIVMLSGDDTLRLPERVLEKDAHYRLYWDRNGALRRDLHGPMGWTSQWLDYTIKTPEDWRRLRDHATYSPDRIAPGTLEAYQRARAQGKAVFYSGHACFHPTWEKIGMERELTLMLENPAFVHDLMEAHIQLMCDLYDGLCEAGMTFDGALIADDLGYVRAPLISPRLYRDIVLPHHRAFVAHLAADGVPAILHSDGNVGPLIPMFIEAGFAGLHPLECKAGLDLRELVPRYGDELVFFGNIDVRALSGTREEIDAELDAKLGAARDGRGYMYHSDHSVPHTVSLESYRYALERVRDYPPNA